MTPVLAIIGGVLLLGSMGMIAAYLRDHGRMLDAIRAKARLADTAVGPVQYVISGNGPVVLSIHGWGGSGVGGYNLFGYLAEQGYTLLEVARPGYLGTPISVGATMEAQADAIAALLDALHIPSAGIIAGSGGGPASVQFALRHPQRCWGMVLVSAMTHPQGAQVSQAQKALRKLFESDFFIWLISKFFWRQLVEDGMGKLSQDIRRDPQKIAALKQLIDGLAVSSVSRDGMRNDFVQWEQMPIYPLEQIRVPTLIIHSRNDASMPYAVAEFTATIPNSRLITFEDGGHTCYMVHSEITHPATLEFLQAHQPEPIGAR